MFHRFARLFTSTALTSSQLTALREEAAIAGDLDMVALCDLAFEDPGATGDQAKTNRIERAQRECLRVIEAAQYDED